MKYFDWDDAKNAKLRTERGIGFEEIVFHIERGDLLDILEHPNPERYGGQRIFVVRREDYVYLVPFVEDEHTRIFRRESAPYLDELLLGGRQRADACVERQVAAGSSARQCAPNSVRSPSIGSQRQPSEQ